MAIKTKNVRRTEQGNLGKEYPPDGYLRGNHNLVTSHSVPLKLTVVDGIVTTTLVQAFRAPSMAGYGDDYFNGWSVVHVGNVDNTSNLTPGEYNLVQDYADDGTFTFTGFDFTGNVTAGEEFSLVPPGAQQNTWNRIINSITYSTVSGTGGQASRELFTVTGMVRCKIVPRCVTLLTGAGSLSLGHESDTDFLIGATVATVIDANEIWASTTAPLGAHFTTDAILDFVVDGLDIGTEATVGTITAGVIQYVLDWQPVVPGSKVVIAAGTGTL